MNHQPVSLQSSQECHRHLILLLRRNRLGNQRESQRDGRRTDNGRQKIQRRAQSPPDCDAFARELDDGWDDDGEGEVVHKIFVRVPLL